MEKLWNKQVEQRFFQEAAKFATPEQLFYVTDTGKHLAYWPKSYHGKKSTLQSRNALIGTFTEKWTTDLIQEIVNDKKLFAVQGVLFVMKLPCQTCPLPMWLFPGTIASVKTQKIFLR